MQGSDRFHQRRYSVRSGIGCALLVAAGVLPPGVAPVRADSLSLESETTPQVKTEGGILQGTVLPGGVRSFKGIPYALPPVGNLRWREPQPPAHWKGVRMADHFGPRAMQPPLYKDMEFRSDGMGEDCLYLNVWTPAHSAKEHLPVLVYIYGGGFFTGDGSETRYDGANLAGKGIVTVTINYRLGVFGFLTHPSLSAESPHHVSGNYGLLDQVAALRWVRRNIAVFGGDPQHVIIGGESAGSYSVSLLMASPLSKGLIAGAIGESGSLLGANPPRSFAETEPEGANFATSLGATSLAALRALPADQLVEAAQRKDAPRFGPRVDGYLLPKTPRQIYADGEQAHVPLLAGWNSAESRFTGTPTPEGVTAAIQKWYDDNAPKVLSVYSVATPQDAVQSAQDLASDRFIAFSTWKWIDSQVNTGGKPVFRYLYAHPLPPTTAASNAPSAPPSAATPDQPTPAPGASHAAEIAYALGNLDLYKYYAWTPDDYAVSKTMQAYFVNFIKTWDPNGAGLPVWPALSSSPSAIMRLDVSSHAEPETHRDRYLVLDSLVAK